MKLTPLALCLALASLPLANCLAADTDPNLAEARGLAKQLGGTLKSELEQAMKSGGPTKAVNACHNKAPDIAKGISKSSGWSVGRTSLKTRNVANQPTPWEKKVLQTFEQRKAAGEDAGQMEYSEIVDVDGKKQYRYMKAIPTAEVCLKCHGAQIAPEVVKELDQLYPSDKARGFAVGDIRGAFTLYKNL